MFLRFSCSHETTNTATANNFRNPPPSLKEWVGAAFVNIQLKVANLNLDQTGD
jgi:hypothetical protein